MKLSNKAVSIALSLVLAISFVLPITSFAESENVGALSEPSIVKKNVAYGDRVQLLFATDVAAESADELKLVYYTLEDGEYVAKNATKLSASDENNYSENGVKYATFVTEGVSPSRTTEMVYAGVYYGDTAPEMAECEKYSLLEYFYDRLYRDGIVNATEGKDLQRKALYEEYIDYADAAQKFFNPTAAKISDFGYVAVRDGSHSLESNLVASGASASLTYSGAIPTLGYYDFEGGLSAWKVTTYAIDGSVSTAEIAADAALTVDGIKIVEPISATGALPEGVTWYAGAANSVSSATVAYYDETRGNVVKFENTVDNNAITTSTKAKLRFLAGENFTNSDTVVFNTEYKIDDLAADYASGVTSDTGAASTKYLGGATYRIQFVNASGGNVCQLQYSFDKYGEAKLYQVASTGATSNALSLPGGTYAVGNWINLTLKVYNATVDGAESTYIDVIATGLKKDRVTEQTVTTTYNLGTVCDLSQIAGVQYYRYDSGLLDSTLYFNNVSITKEAASE